MPSRFIFLLLFGLLLAGVSQPITSQATHLEQNAEKTYSLPDIDWTNYHNYSEIERILLGLNDTFADHVDLFSIGKSWQDRDIYCVKITNETDTATKPKLLFVGYHHAREPITAELTLYFAVMAAEDFGNDETITRILNATEIFIIVALNVDGFEAVKQNEWQRKNVYPIDEDGDGLVDEDLPDDEDGDGYIEALYRSFGFVSKFLRWEGVDDDYDGLLNEDWTGGVDLNRNYEFQWNASCYSGSLNETAEDYRGPQPFSEPETQAVRDFALQHNFSYAVSFHSGIEVVLYPWGYTETLPPDADILREVAGNLSELTNAPYEQSAMIYTMSGSWDDWMYGNRSTLALTCEIYEDALEWRHESEPDNDTFWLGGILQVFNPSPNDIPAVIKRWLPVFTYCANRSIDELFIHDVAVTSIAPTKNCVGKKPEGSLTSIETTLTNHGEVEETLNVTLYIADKQVQTCILNVPPETLRIVCFDWNTSGWDYGNHSLTVHVDPVWWETDTGDNTLTEAWILLTIPGDLNADQRVDSVDAMELRESFGLTANDTAWNPNADVNDDRVVSCRDAVIMGSHFNHHVGLSTVCFDGYNDNETEPAFLYYPTPSPWYAVEYKPTTSYEIKKIELIAGGAEGNFTVQLRLDDEGVPSNVVLREASFVSTTALTWQGTEFNESYLLFQNTTYWIVFKPYPGTIMSASLIGTNITTAINYGYGWQSIADQKWMMKFHAEVKTEQNASALTFFGFSDPRFATFR